MCTADLSALDLQPTTFSNYEDYISKLSIDEIDLIQLDSLSNAQLDISSDVAVYQPDVATQIENQAPIADPILMRVNPEAQMNGEDTTESIFFLYTRVHDQYLCYDPDGDNIYLAWDATQLPEGYIAPLEADDFAGYLIHIFNKGSYPFIFAFYDSFGAMSPILSTEFNIMSRADCEVIEGNLTSEDQVDVYSITLDYSKIEHYYLELLNIGGSLQHCQGVNLNLDKNRQHLKAVLPNVGVQMQ